VPGPLSLTQLYNRAWGWWKGRTPLPKKSKVSDVDLSMSLLRVQVLSQSVKKENSLQFYFRVRFYPENVEEELIQDVTRVSTR